MNIKWSFQISDIISQIVKYLLLKLFEDDYYCNNTISIYIKEF